MKGIHFVMKRSGTSTIVFVASTFFSTLLHAQPVPEELPPADAIVTRYNDLVERALAASPARAGAPLF